MKKRVDGIFWCSVAAVIVLCVQAILDNSQDLFWVAVGVGGLGGLAYMYSKDPIA